MTQAGWLHVICGPMFSGKTEELLRLVRRLSFADKKVGVFRPAQDTRDSAVSSRSGAYFPGHMVKDSDGLRAVAEAMQLDVIAVDEAQFFDAGLTAFLRDAADAGVIVLVSGLDKDFLGRTFGPMGELLIEADQVTKLSAICTRCKRDASRTQRLVEGKPASPSDPLVLIGGREDDRYEARCRGCHEVGA